MRVCTSTVRHVEIVLHVGPTLGLRFAVVVVDFTVGSVGADHISPSSLPVGLARLLIVIPFVLVDPIVVNCVSTNLIPTIVVVVVTSITKN